ncbi:MAG: hypothetical protein GY778_26370 [bacterium]|nr:hypothetical protein [bacterium]
MLDLVSISPIDTRALARSVSKTGRAVVVHEGPRNCGIAAEVIARINETAFEHLEAPLKRVTGVDIPFPFFQVERFYLPDADTIATAALETLRY